ncbi:MAG: magnesium transporter [Phycisphaerales bacterium]
MNPTAALLEPEVHELISSGNYAELRDVLHGLPPADVADLLSGINPEQAAIAFRFLPRDDGAVVFTYLDPAQQEALVRQLGDRGAVKLIEAMQPDDRVRLLDELPPEVAARLVASLPPEDRKETQAILGYPPRSVGRLMTPDYIRIRSEWSVARAIDHIRRHGRDAETINVVYVIDDAGMLVDDMRLRTLILAEPDASIESLMNRQFVALRAEQPQEEAVEALQKYDRVALPVVDSRGALLGIVTHDDVADVAQQAATEAMQKLGGVEALEEPYISTPYRALIRKRAVWLCILFAGQLLTATVIEHFEARLAAATFLLAMMPLIISSGGNSGSQAASLLIRAIALREVTFADGWRIARKELAMGLSLGSILGVLGTGRIVLWHHFGWADYGEHYLLVAFTVGTSLVAIVMWATLTGALLPLVLRRCGLDPATSSTPFIATLMDVTGLLIYFTVAIVVLSGSVL